MAFVQIIEFETPDIDALHKLDEGWVQATAGKRTARRQITARDRNAPNRYLRFVFFDSYESAMENSELSETAEFAAKQQAMTSGATFRDLDIVSDDTL